MMRKTFPVILGLIAACSAYAGGPYPTQTGISAAADSALTASGNPAGITRFNSMNIRVDLHGFSSDNTFEGQVGDAGPTIRSVDENTTVIPHGNIVVPLRDNLWFGFTILGSGFEEDFGDDWIGRYFLQEYQLLYVSMFPSLATKINDKLSVAGSLAITYTSYEQDKAVLNVDDPTQDGKLNIDTDGFSIGFGLSALYEVNDQTRFGLVYRSELDPELDGKASFSNLTPTTEAILDAAGLLNAKIDVTSRSPQSITAGMYHEFADTSAVVFDLIWADFSEFKLSEVYVEGNQIVETDAIYEDIFGLSVGYNLPLNDRWRLGFGALYIDDMIEDDNRTLTLRLDSMWSLGIGFQWRWKKNRVITGSLNYVMIDDAPVNTPAIPGVGSVTGRYTERKTIWLQIGINTGSGT
jgi:long-chain fatty acid transport protein